MDYQHILYATDLEDHEAAKRAQGIAQKLGGELFLLHIIEPPASVLYAAALGFSTFPDPVTDDAELVMATLGDELGVPSARQFVKIGSTASLVLAFIAEHQIDLLILGHHTPRGLPGFLSSTAHKILPNAQCEVLTLST